MTYDEETNLFAPFDDVAPLDAPDVIPGDGAEEEEEPAPAPPLPVGDRVVTLRALRAELAHRIPNADDGIVPGLVKQMRETLAELAELEPAAPAGEGLAALLRVVED